MIRVVLISFLIFESFLLFPQNTIKGTIPGLPNKEIYLIKLIAEKHSFVDSASTDVTGSFIFELATGFPTGQYAVVAGPNQMIELIYNKENIRFVTTGARPDNQVQIVESVENKIYYEYLYLKGMTLYKTDLLNPLILQYPNDDPFHKTIINEYIYLKENLNDRVTSLSTENPETFTSHIIRTDKPLLPDPTLTLQEQKLFLKNHYFDETDFTDTLLTRTNILSSKVVGYLSLFQENNMTKEQLEDNLLVALDTVLSHAAVNQQVYEYVVDFLINGFHAIGFEKGLEFVAEHNQLDNFCENTQRKKELEGKIELIKKLSVGQPAPDFETVDLLGKMFRLSDVGAERTILIFWASWCPHCVDILPELKKHYNPKTRRQLEIVAISIDESRGELESVIENNGYNQWINIGELQGWNGPIVEEYGISATPTIFVLDKDKTIIAKPSNNAELERWLTN